MNPSVVVVLTSILACAVTYYHYEQRSIEEARQCRRQQYGELMRRGRAQGPKSVEGNEGGGTMQASADPSFSCLMQTWRRSMGIRRLSGLGSWRKKPGRQTRCKALLRWAPAGRAALPARAPSFLYVPLAISKPSCLHPVFLGHWLIGTPSLCGMLAGACDRG